MTLRALISKGWQHATTTIFLVGFVTDSFLLPEIDNPATKYLGLSYLVILAIMIYLREWVISRNTASDIERKAFSVLTFGVSFFSGAALSFVFVYAMRSAAFAVSWPLFVILVICMTANEFIASHHYRFTLDIAVFFVAVVFYAIFNVPILFLSVNDFVFMISIVLSVSAGLLYIYLLQRSSEAAYYERGRGYALALGIPMFVGMLYLLNVIPAVPLSLKSSGVYHSVSRVNDASGGSSYVGTKETDTRLFASLRRQTYHMTDDDRGIYFFSSIGAPAQIAAPITHVWEYYDASSNSWVISTTVSFNLSGGRKDGYRAYSMKENLHEGLWRVTVKVDDKRIVGRQRFYIVKGANVALEEVKL